MHKEARSLSSTIMKNKILLGSTSILTTILLAGCLTVGPEYEAPEPNVPDAWHRDLAADSESGTNSLQNWWTLFEDETLNDLINRATTNNLNLKTAAARIEQARALRGVASSEFFPAFSAEGAGGGTGSSSDAIDDGDFYSAGVRMGWELDLWGRVRRSVESAGASLQATEENYRDLMVLLYADVANSYINVRTLQKRIALAERNLAAQAETMELTQNRFDAGLVPALDISQAELNKSRTEATLPPLRQALVETVNRLGVLLGEMPYALESELLQGKAVVCAECGHEHSVELELPELSIPTASGVITPSLPADLVRQRPDIRRAERELAAQNAQIGVAVADFYPAFSLPGSLVVETGGITTYRLGPQIRWNLFSGGRIRSQVRAEKAATQAALHAYEQTVLLALEEVEDSLAAYAYEQDRVQLLETAAVSAEKSVELVSELYRSGLTDFQNVLNMEQALLVQQDELAASRGRVSTGLITIYKALGGGWAPPSEDEK